MKDQIYKQRFFEAGNSESAISISRVMTSKGEYVYMIDCSEHVYDYLDLKLPVFNHWSEVWSFFKSNYPGWWNYKPFFIHDKVNGFLLLELKSELKELSIASKKFWRSAIRPFWKSCLKEELQELLQ